MKTERVFAILFLFTLFLKLQNIPFASVLYVMTLSTLSVLYFMAGSYFFSDVQFKRQKLPLSIVSGISLAIALIGLEFKMQFWPGTTVLLLIGCIAAPAIAIISYYLRSKDSGDLVKYYSNMVLRSSIIGSLCWLFMFTPDGAIIRYKYQDDPEYARLYTLHVENPGNNDYFKQLREYEDRKAMGSYYQDKERDMAADTLQTVDGPR